MSPKCLPEAGVPTWLCASQVITLHHTEFDRPTRVGLLHIHLRSFYSGSSFTTFIALIRPDQFSRSMAAEVPAPSSRYYHAYGSVVRTRL